MIIFKLLFMIFQPQGILFGLYLSAYHHTLLCLVVIKLFYSLIRLMIPDHMLPNTNHPSTLSILQCENHTVVNVLVDLVIAKLIAYTTALDILFQAFFNTLLKTHELLDILFIFVFVLFPIFIKQRFGAGMKLFYFIF